MVCKTDHGSLAVIMHGFITDWLFSISVAWYKYEYSRSSQVASNRSSFDSYRDLSPQNGAGNDGMMQHNALAMTPIGCEINKSSVTKRYVQMVMSAVQEI